MGAPAKAWSSFCGERRSPGVNEPCPKGGANDTEEAQRGPRKSAVQLLWGEEEPRSE